MRIAIALMAGITAFAAAARLDARQPASLPTSLGNHLRAERFEPITAVAALPAGVRDALGALFGEGPLQLAEPGAPFQSTDVVVSPRLPWRRLISAGCAADHCLVHYEKGGFAHVFNVVVLSRSGSSAARVEWGGRAPGALGDVQAVRDAIAAGTIQGQTKYW